VLRIDLLYCQPYSPNHNLIERFWEFLKCKVEPNRYQDTFVEFQKVLKNLLDYCAELASLLTDRFQLFTTP
jgi:hypothetical protein